MRSAAAQARRCDGWRNKKNKPLSKDKTMRAVWVLVAAVVLPQLVIAQGAGEKRLNEVRGVGARMSYHQRDESRAEPIAWRFWHAGVAEQLDQKARVVEMDFYWDAGRMTVANVRGYDDKASCATLRECLSAVASWARVHPLHEVIHLFLRARESEIVVAPDWVGVWELVMGVWDHNRIISAQTVFASPDTKARWPTVDEARGALMVYAVNPRGIEALTASNAAGKTGFIVAEPINAFVRGRVGRWTGCLYVDMPLAMNPAVIKTVVAESGLLVKVAVDSGHVHGLDFFTQRDVEMAAVAAIDVDANSAVTHEEYYNFVMACCAAGLSNCGSNAGIIRSDLVACAAASHATEPLYAFSYAAAGCALRSSAPRLTARPPTDAQVLAAVAAAANAGVQLVVYDSLTAESVTAWLSPMSARALRSQFSAPHIVSALFDYIPTSFHDIPEHVTHTFIERAAALLLA